jgi:ubiquinone/menaquinone biosynthesis C-methylase UbiE
MDLRNAAAEHLPYGNSEFDLVISRVSLPYTDLPKAAREMRRVLRTGGRIWLALHDFRMFKRQWTGSRTWRERSPALGGANPGKQNRPYCVSSSAVDFTR